MRRPQRIEAGPEADRLQQAQHLGSRLPGVSIERLTESINPQIATQNQSGREKKVPGAQCGAGTGRFNTLLRNVTR